MKRIETVGVIGLGVMGAAIALNAASAGYDVVFKELNEGLVNTMFDKWVTAPLAGKVEKGRISRAEADRISGKIRGTARYRDLAGCDLIIEAAVEDIDLKKKIFKTLSDTCGADTIIVSNTSTFPIGELMADVARPERTAGLVGIAAYGAMGYWGGPAIGRAIAYLPARILYPFIFLTAIAAAYSTRASLLDIAIALIFGVFGYIMRRTEFSTAAFVIAFVLAKNAEEAFRQALLLSDDGILIFVKEPVALAFLIVGIAVLLLRSFTVLRRSRRASAGPLGRERTCCDSNAE